MSEDNPQLQRRFPTSRQILLVMVSGAVGENTKARCYNLPDKIEEILLSEKAQQNHLIRKYFTKDPVFKCITKLGEQLFFLFQSKNDKKRVPLVNYTTKKYEIDGATEDVYIYPSIRKSAEMLKEVFSGKDYKFLINLGRQIS